MWRISSSELPSASRGSHVTTVCAAASGAARTETRDSAVAVQLMFCSVSESPAEPRSVAFIPSCQ